MKKKHVALLLSAAMVLSLTACGGGSDAPATDEAPAESSGDETAAPEESDASETEETDSAAAPANDTLVASVEQGLEGKFSPYFSLAANDTMIDEMVRVYTMEVDRVGNPILNGIEGETRSYNGTDYTYYTASNIEITENEDGTVFYDMTIRDDIKFTDGTTADIDDVMDTMAGIMADCLSNNLNGVKVDPEQLADYDIEEMTAFIAEYYEKFVGEIQNNPN